MFKAYKTKTRIEDSITFVCLHNTDIVTFDSFFISLNTGGHNTILTKRRMNEVSDYYNLNYKVFQKDFNWFVDFRGTIYPFSKNRLQLLYRR